ncbi:MAG TPA: NUDIX domain-containing protein [Candidatus Limnocylindrales bacterium]|jgi:8-oxo-dGTP pyrophosphatase MutT (NUDIX family)
MSPLRPDLVDCWIFRATTPSRPDAALELLLLRRAPGRILAGLWQCVSGSLEADERIAHGALREVREETGFDSAEIENLYDLDLVNQFHEPSVDAVLLAAVFAVRVRPGAEPTLSHEHDDARWLTIDAAHREVVWPGYRTAIERIRDDLVGSRRAAWFELTLDGDRPPR